MGLYGNGIGQPVRREEDPKLLKGQGRYTDDLNLARQARAYVVRSPSEIPFPYTLYPLQPGMSAASLGEGAVPPVLGSDRDPAAVEHGDAAQRPPGSHPDVARHRLAERGHSRGAGVLRAG